MVNLVNLANYNPGFASMFPGHCTTVPVSQFQSPTQWPYPTHLQFSNPIQMNQPMVPWTYNTQIQTPHVQMVGQILIGAPRASHYQGQNFIYPITSNHFMISQGVWQYGGNWNAGNHGLYYKPEITELTNDDSSEENPGVSQMEEEVV